MSAAPMIRRRHSTASTPGARAAASREEVLRHRDIAALTPAEREHLRVLLARLSLRGEVRTSRRMRTARRGRIDGRRTVRAWLAAGGEPAQLRRHRHTARPRRVVLLVDVSGSMAAYADALLRFTHAAARRTHTPTEVFALGTRLSRITRELQHPDPDVAMAAVAEAIPDAGGGTRLGLLLKEFIDRWGQRGLASGAVVVVLSDGWERGDPSLLGEQTRDCVGWRIAWCGPTRARRRPASRRPQAAWRPPSLTSTTSSRDTASTRCSSWLMWSADTGGATAPIRRRREPTADEARSDRARCRRGSPVRRSEGTGAHSVANCSSNGPCAPPSTEAVTRSSS